MKLSLKRRALLLLAAALVLFAAAGAQAGMLSSIRPRQDDGKIDLMMIRPAFLKPAALVFEREVGNANWQHKASNGDLLISFNMENLDPDADIDAFDLAVYCEDAYEEMIYPLNCANPATFAFNVFTISETVRAGRTHYTGNCNFSNFPGARYVYVAVKRYHYTKGSTPDGKYRTPDGKNTVTIDPEDLEWHYWVVD